MKRDILLARQIREQRFEPAQETFQAVLVAVDYSDSANVARQPGFVWFQELEPGDPTPGIAFNRKVPALPDLKVTIKRWPKIPFDYEVIDWDPGQVKNLPGYSGTPLLVQHARDHEPGGYDPLNIYQEMLVPLRTDPGGGLTVNVAGYRYTLNGVSVVFGGHNGYSLASHVPTSGVACFVLVYLDTATNALSAVAGDTTVDMETVQPTKPDIPVGGIGSAYVRLAGGQTEIERSDIEPAREWLRPVVTTITGAWPAPGEIMIGTIKYVTIDAAIAAASAGDTIKLGEGTYTYSGSYMLVDKNLILTCQYPGAATITRSDGSLTAVCTAASVSFQNILFANHYTGGDSIAFQSTSTIVNFYNCLFQMIAFGGTRTNFALNILAGYANIFECQAIESGGDSDSAAINFGGSSNGGLIVDGTLSTSGTYAIIVSSGTVKLNIPVVSYGVIPSGCLGLYYDSSQNLRIVGATKFLASDSQYPDIGSTTAAQKFGNVYLGSQKDLFPAADTAGIHRRTANFYTLSQVEDDFNGALSGWTWASSPFVTPSFQTTGYPSLFAFGNNANARMFMYKSVASSNGHAVIASATALESGAYFGVRMDDGSDNNYIEIVAVYNNASTFGFQARWRIGGGGVSTSILQYMYNNSRLMTLGIQPVGTPWSNWNPLMVLGFDNPAFSLYVPTTGLTWSPTRYGPVYVNATTSDWKTIYIDKMILRSF